MKYKIYFLFIGYAQTRGTYHRDSLVVAGGFGRLIPPNKAPTPQIGIWNTINQWSFCQFFSMSIPLHKREAPLLNFLATVLTGDNLRTRRYKMFKMFRHKSWQGGFCKVITKNWKWTNF